MLARQIDENYSIKSTLYESSKTLIALAYSKKLKKDVIIKTAQDESPDQLNQQRFIQEYSLLSSHPSAGILDCYDLIKMDKRYGVVLESIDGVALSNIIKSIQPLSSNDFLSMAINITNSVSHIHSEKIIHKDINPSNIIWNQKTNTATVIDFETAIDFHHLDHDETATINLEGSLAYIAPEQTGRINRSIDYRSDLYSLGITLYHLISGQLPFQETDPNKLIHAHLAVKPTPLTVLLPDLQAIIWKIIEKLIQKEPDERYQSAFGLLHDLSLCQDALIKSQTIPVFKLGCMDRSSFFRWPKELIGRTQETKHIHRSLKSVATGSPQVLIIEGDSGIGKTALIKAQTEHFKSASPFYCHCECQPDWITNPYKTISSLLEPIIETILTMPKNPKQVISAAITSAVQQNGQLIIQILPELEKLIGPQSDLPTLNSQDSQSRFTMTFNRFIETLCTHQHPLILSIDNIHWADTVSLQLFQRILSSHQSLHIFLLISYCPTSADQDSIRSLTNLYSDLISDNHIELKEFSLAEVNTLLSQCCYRQQDDLNELASIIHTKTFGNPYVMKALIDQLLNQNALFFHAANGNWDWDIKTIQECDVYSNLEALLAHRFKSLEADCISLCQLGSCIGHSFSIQLLQKTTSKTVPELFRTLFPAIQQGILRLHETALRTSSIEDCELILATLADKNYAFKFFHEKLQQIAYDSMSIKNRLQAHYQIGNALLTQQENRNNQQTITITNHLNKAQSLISNNELLIELCQLNYQSGDNVKKVGDFQAAFVYSEKSIHLLQSSPWQSNYEFTFSLFTQYCQTAYLTGQQDLAQSISNDILSNVNSMGDMAATYLMLTVQNTVTGNLSKAIRYGVEGLSKLGLKLPEQPSMGRVLMAILDNKWLLRKIDPKTLMNLPEMTDPKIKLMMQILLALAVPCYLENNENLLALTLLRLLKNTLKFGKSPESSSAFVGFGLLLSSIFQDYKKAQAFGQLSIDICEYYDDFEARAKNYFVFALFINSWNTHWTQIQSLMQTAYSAGLRSGDWFYGAFSLVNSVWDPSIDLHTQRELNQKNLKLIHSMNYDDAWMNLKIHDLHLLNIQDPSRDHFILNDENFDELEYLKTMKARNYHTSIAVYYYAKLRLHTLFYDYEKAIIFSKEGEPSLPGIAGQPRMIDYYLFSFIAYCRLLSTKQKRGVIGQLLIHLKIRHYFRFMKKARQACESNFSHSYWIMAAERASLKKQHLSAQLAYEKAISEAIKHHFDFHAAFYYELAGLYYDSINHSMLAKICLNEAIDRYQQYGAVSKVIHIQSQFGEKYNLTNSNLESAHSHHTITNNATTKHSTVHHSSFTSTTTHVNALDMQAILKAAQVISKEIHTDRILAQLLEIIMTYSGAQTCHLILYNDLKDRYDLHAKCDGDLSSVTYFTDVPVDSYEKLPNSLINQVLTSKTVVVLEQASELSPYDNDPYLRTNRIKSILCSPILSQGFLRGIIYLENNQINGAFNPKRIQAVDLLASQAAVSIENASIYEQLEAKVNERTKALAQEKEKALEASAEAKRANEFKSTFLAQMTHDLRTPLHVVIGILDVLKKYKKVQADSTMAKPLDIALKSGERQLGLVNDILDLSKIEAGKIDILEEPFVFVELFEGIDEQMGTLLRGKNVKFALEGTPPSPAIISDKKRLQQVITNLLSNSAKFTTEGSISLSVGRTPPSPPFLRGGITPVKLDVSPPYEGGDQEGVCPTQRLYFSVSDSGIGMTPENAKRVFESYTMIENELQKKVQGTGLGLSICKGFVEALGGKIWCESEKGNGTSFIFWIPFKPVENFAETFNDKLSSVEDAIDYALLKEKYILMIDDDEFNRAFAQMILEGKARYKMAASGQEALALIKSEEFDLIFTDMEMPELDGKDTFKALRKINKSTPIVVLTAKAMKGVREELLDFGFNGYLAKPFKENELLSYICSHFQRSTK